MSHATRFNKEGILFVQPLQPLVRHLPEHVVIEALKSDDAILATVKAHYFRNALDQILSETLLRNHCLIK